MSDISPQLDPELMLRHARGLRALVQELVIDDSRVDDVLQETWLRALERPPHSTAALGSWLRKVASRLAVRARGRDYDRARREERAAVDGSVPPASEIVDRELARRRLVDAVFDLREPYRTAILLRYFETLDARAIARRLDLPIETVRTRIKRGLACLRRELDDSAGGDRRRWHAALLPVLTLPVAMPAKTVGIAAPLLTRLAVALWLVLMGVAAYLAQSGSDGAAEPPPTVAFTEFEREPAEDGSGPPAEGDAAERAAPSNAARHGAKRSLLEPAATPPRAHLTVEGRVVGAHGAPLAHARVSLRLWHGDNVFRDRVARPVTTDARGRFRFEGPAYEETTFLLGVTHAELAAASATHRWHAKEGAIDVGDIALERGGRVTGRLVDGETGAPLAGARVELLASFHARPGSQVEALLTPRVRTDAAGAFALPRVPPGTWLVCARAPDRMPAYTPQFRTGTGQDVELASLEVVRGSALCGVVRDGNGLPVAGASVRVLARDSWPPPQARTGDDGRFELRGLSRGSLRLSITHWRHATAQHVVDDAAATRFVELELAARGSLAGRVIDADTGEPIEGFAVKARDDDASGRGNAPSGSTLAEQRAQQKAWIGARLGGAGVVPRSAGRPRTHPHGAFRLHGLQPGQHVLDVHAPGYVRHTAGPVEVSSGACAEVVIALTRGRAITGRVVDQRTGLPMAGAAVALYLPRPGEAACPVSPGLLLLRETSGDNGQFDLGRYPPGSFRIRIEAVDRVARVEDLLLAAHADTELSLALERGARVRGHVRGWMRGERAQVVLTHESGGRHTAPVDPHSGEYEVAGLRAGSYTARVRHNDDPAPPWSRPRGGFDVVLAADADRRLDLAPDAERGTVTGRIAPTNARTAGLHARLRSAGADPATAFGGDNLHADIDQHGCFAIEAVPPGSYVLELVRLGAPPLHAAPVSVAAGRPSHVEVELATR